MRCPHCDGEDCIQVEIQLKGEDQIQFYSCRRCEEKWWVRDGDTIALDDVLNLTSEREGKK